MPFLSDQDRGVLKERFDNELDHTVRVVLFTEPDSGLFVPGARTCESCADTEALMDEVAGISEKIQLEIHNIKEETELASQWNVEAAPTIAICREEDAGIRFMGLPSGYEFTSFLETVISTGSDNYGLAPENVAKLEGLEADLHIKTFSTPT